MTVIDEAALPDASSAGPQGTRRAMRVIGPIVVVLALLSALATFLVLGGFTPLAPSHYVNIGLLAFNAIAVLLLLAIIAREIWPLLLASRRGRAAARPYRRLVLRHRRGAGHPGCDRRQRHPRSRHRSDAVHPRVDPQHPGDRRNLCARADPGAAGRHPGHGDQPHPGEAAVRP